MYKNSALNEPKLYRESSQETNDDSLIVSDPKYGFKVLPENILDNLKTPKNSHLLIETPGCKIPKLDPWDPSVAHLIYILEPFKCCGHPLLMYQSLDGSIHLNETVLFIHYDMRPHQIKCAYQGIHREHEWENLPFETGYSTTEQFPMEFGVPLNEEFIGVSCNLNEVFYLQYFAFTPLKDEVEEDRKTKAPPEHRLNVILAGVDSISKLNFLRHFPKTRSFIKNKMHSFSMRGFNKVGDNTFPNLVPLLTGHHVEHYFNESMKETFFFDSIDLIWKDYAKRGYRTFYAEDNPYIGTFHYSKRGFNDPPTDYYLRTILLAMDHKQNKDQAHHMCVNSQLETDFIYKYLKDFITVMDTRPYIAFAMVSKMTHDYPNYASYADEPTVHMLEDLWHSGALNNSVLVLFSDHGIRYGEIRNTYIGKFEDKMPFMYIHFPKWFLEQHPDMAKNLETNQERLVTLFDVHATMIHLLDINQDRASPEIRSMTEGSSLLTEISSDRTCEQANIKEHFCPCQSYELVPADDLMASAAAKEIVDDINRQLLPFKDSCAHLELESILDARVSEVEVEWHASEGDYYPHRDYLITIVTKPGQATFDSTVRLDPTTRDFNVLGISRTNMYGDQSKCIDSHKMKLFCFCKK